MKIALIRKEYMDSHGGAERYAVSLAKGLATLGHSVYVFAGKWDKEQHPNIILNRVPFIKFPSPLKNLTFQHNVRSLLVNNDFDIVNGLSQVFPQDVYRMGDGLHIHWLRIQTPNPGERILQYLNPRHQVILLIEREIFKKDHYRRIISTSCLCTNQLIHYYKVPEENIQLVYNGVDLKKFNQAMKDILRKTVRERLGISKEVIALLFVGHNFKRKGLHLAIHWASGLQEQGYRVKLIVAGRGEPAPFLRIARRKEFSNNIIFLGQVKNMKALYHASDILIHPALYDPFSNVCLESMACGLPVITTKQTGASEIIAHGSSGLIVDTPGEVEKLLSEISTLLGNGCAGLRIMGDRAALMAQDYSMDHNIQKTVAVYEEVLREKGIHG